MGDFTQNFNGISFHSFPAQEWERTPLILIDILDDTTTSPSPRHNRERTDIETDQQGSSAELKTSALSSRPPPTACLASSHGEHISSSHIYPTGGVTERTLLLTWSCAQKKSGGEKSWENCLSWWLTCPHRTPCSPALHCGGVDNLHLIL